MRLNLFRLSALAILGLSVALSSASPSQAQNVRVTGSGASFPFPLYSAWFQAFGSKNRGIRIDY